jgi:putative DNA primase/helicase
MNYGFDAEEFDKRIAAMLFTPAPCLIIDNANGKRISNDTLETAITEGMVDIRPLGQTARVSIVNRSMIVTTGNGVELSGDMTRRALGIEIEPKSSSPETEVYAYTPDEYVAERRDELLTAAFTLMRAYRRAGMPKLAKTSAGSFPEWERHVRDLVMWLFKVDAAQQFVRNRDNASDKRAHAALLHALHGAFADSRSGQATF